MLEKPWFGRGQYERQVGRIALKPGTYGLLILAIE